MPAPMVVPDTSRADPQTEPGSCLRVRGFRLENSLPSAACAASLLELLHASFCLLCLLVILVPTCGLTTRPTRMMWQWCSCSGVAQIMKYRSESSRFEHRGNLQSSKAEPGRNLCIPVQFQTRSKARHKVTTTVQLPETATGASSSCNTFCIPSLDKMHQHGSY